MIERRNYELPPDLVIDRLTAYIFKHYRHLLNAEETALERLRIARGKALGAQARHPEAAFPERGQELERLFRVNSLAEQHPDLYRRLHSSTVAAEMASARDRVMRDFADQIVLNKCPKCGSLCLTPHAKACVDCGHTWHHHGEEK
jgi:hypothetical protein